MRALAGERAIALSTVETIEKLAGDTLLVRLLVRIGWGVTGLHDLDRIVYLEGMDRYMAHAENPTGLAPDGSALVADIPKLYIITHVFLPQQDSALNTSIKLDALRRATIAGLATKRYRLDCGKFPDSLDACVPDYLEAVPTDPFDGKPLKYTYLEHEAVIYSIGSDGVDNSGASTGKQVSSDPDTDIVFTVQR